MELDLVGVPSSEIVTVPIGTLVVSRLSASSDRFRSNGVSINPGATALIRIFLDDISTASARVNPTMPAFADA